MKDLEPKIIVFCCSWSVYPGLQLSVSSRRLASKKAPFGTIVTMCAGRIEPELILEAFNKGAQGVMVAGCPLDECEHNGNYKLMRRFFSLKNLLKQFNIDPKRLKLEWVSTGESAKLQKMINNFVDEITKLDAIK